MSPACCVTVLVNVYLVYGNTPVPSAVIPETYGVTAVTLLVAAHT